MKVLLVTLYFPPAGGGGVQRPLKLAQHLPALGIETHVLAPDDPKWIHRDDELRVPTQAWVHRARYVGPKGRKPAEELHGTTGLERALVHARLASRRLLVPDENVTWNLTAIPAAIRIARAGGDRRRDHDLAAELGPPRRRRRASATGCAWVADLRDSLVAHPHRRAESVAVRAKEKATSGVARLVARWADAIVVRLRGDRRRDARARAARPGRARSRTAATSTTSPGSSTAAATRFRITHTGSFFGKRDPRPFLKALADSGSTSSPASSATSAPPTASGPRTLGLGDRLELIPYAPRRRALELQRDSEALLLLIPEAGGRGKGVLSGKVFEYLAAERPILAAVPPDGAAADADPRDGRRASSRRPTTSTASRGARRRCTSASRNGGLPATAAPGG